MKPTAPFSEVQAALDASKAGDHWPYLILEYMAGNRAPMIAAVRSFGVEPHSVGALFVADLLAGKIKATRRDALLRREHDLLVRVQRYALLRRKQNEFGIKTMADVFRVVGNELHMTADAVEKATTRHRRAATR